MRVKLRKKAEEKISQTDQTNSITASSHQSPQQQLSLYSSEPLFSLNFSCAPLGVPSCRLVWSSSQRNHHSGNPSDCCSPRMGVRHGWIEGWWSEGCWSWLCFGHSSLKHPIGHSSDLRNSDYPSN